MEKKLNHYDLDTVLEAFDIDVVSQCIYLDEWLNFNPIPLPKEELYVLELARKRLIEYGNFWNESQRRTVRAQNEICERSFKPCQLRRT